MGIFRRPQFRGHRNLLGKGRKETEADRVITECYCMNGHGLITAQATFQGYNGITLLLKNERSEGLLSLSPVIGDLRRKFFDFEPVKGENVEICCPVCAEALPVYDLCPCHGSLVALFLTPNEDFSRCIAICQRIGCLHSEIKSNRDLRIFSRLGYFESDANRLRR